MECYYFAFDYELKIMSSGSFVPALGYDFLTSYYDKVVGLTTREAVFKKALVHQSAIGPQHRVLDLACGTGTLTIMVKEVTPEADVTGIDGDNKILELARSKGAAQQLDIRFDNGMSFDLPYPDESFDRVFSSLFFHHLTRENKLKTLSEVKRVLRPNAEFHVADWGLPSNRLMKFSSRFVQLLDGFETTADNFEGQLPVFMTETGFTNVEETGSFNTLFGTIRLHQCTKK